MDALDALRDFFDARGEGGGGGGSETEAKGIERDLHNDSFSSQGTND